LFLERSIASPAQDRGPSPLFRALGNASIGIEMGVATAIGWYAGYWADGRLGTGPWLMLVGLLFGVAAGFRGLYRAARQAQRETAAPPAASKPSDEDGSWTPRR
jgi:ATP synthase protein I